MAPDEHLFEPPAPVDTTRPNAARMYDYYLGGSANFEADRDAAEAGLAAMPFARDYAKANRAFLGRAVAHLVRGGIDQFLDLGSGVPTVGNVHEIARAHDPAARVAYVDHEPVAVSHARRLLADLDGVTVTQADIRDPQAVLTAPGVAELLDFDRPVAVLAVAILPFVPEQAEALSVVGAYRAACVPGSPLVVSHISALAATPEQVADAEEVMARTPTPVRWRPREEVEELFTGYELIEPGLVPAPMWRPDRLVTEQAAAPANAFAGVGTLRG
ncbi:SAM-dependent methyltransferase [Saccharopolyspora sp. HNM0983]|uniref:SAM-dependent methyltransferase n=1 Tax=Saccharopolyspora montiporae TaxID=2781240 RepID=A0A929B6W6_9PSEU|nr:SAM-dependent methyltransferase [Saccharopolyspora sp. HNM0983]MBE9372925.1 SAM-dependent methyltransferase [Saccharopolyspora sp. HNM0983]